MVVVVPALESDSTRGLVASTLEDETSVYLHSSPIFVAGHEDKHSSIGLETGRMKLQDHTRSTEQLETLVQHSIALQVAVAGPAERVRLVVLHRLIESEARRSDLDNSYWLPSCSHIDVTFCFLKCMERPSLKQKICGRVQAN